MIWKDPTGLAPQKEKKGKVQWSQVDNFKTGEINNIITTLANTGSVGNLKAEHALFLKEIIHKRLSYENISVEELTELSKAMHAIDMFLLGGGDKNSGGDTATNKSEDQSNENETNRESDKEVSNDGTTPTESTTTSETDKTVTSDKGNGNNSNSSPIEPNHLVHILNIIMDGMKLKDIVWMEFLTLIRLHGRI